MSGILDLAKAFEETSKQQAQRTGESVKSEFVKLENSISEALQSSGKSISDAIHEQNTRQTAMLRRTVTIALTWILVCGALLIGLLSGILWYQGTLIVSQLDEMNSYSQQLTDLKAKSGAGVEILTDDKLKNTYYVVLPKNAKGAELYSSQNGNRVVKYTAK
ncbi:MbeB family mobilization protein [Enterobacter hormaechei]|uniref:MbeB family mobilization protein n=1 Tax=Enterobacter hormaechei TaxID=158836 RepID=UPI0024142669|nr:MbeB family mobilization protein [Enterobacter hormaechei]MDG4714143.1 MbeB family mobilization protein [Enterobacter hormaechei]MDG4726539.1 MbeB family mobilization protein [Enterobacter hormaechei]